MKVHIPILIVFFFIQTYVSLCQKEGNIWYFGEYAGVDFNSGSPIAITNGSINTAEGCASMCDANGNLLFYTDGSEVYNKDHNLMQNGDNLMGHNSASQSSVIVPNPGNYLQYYVFTVDARENNLANGLRYSIVDMSLDNGLGAVTSDKNILLHTPVCEKVTAVKHFNDTDYWLITHEWESDAFLVYRIIDLGIMTPVISNIGSVHSGTAPDSPPMANAIGQLKASPNGQKLALAISRDDIYEFFDFDNTTGIVLNPITTPAEYHWSYGVEFSPDNSKLYVVKRNDPFEIIQYNLLAGTNDDILNSATIVGTVSSNFAALQIGPDGKIYVAKWYNGHLGVINNPNATIPVCEYTDNGVYLNGRQTIWGLTNIFYARGFYNNIEDKNINNYRIFPVPSDDMINIDLCGVLEEVNIDIYKITGELIKSEVINGKCHSSIIVMSINDLIPGTYIVKLVTDNMSLTKKFIKN